MSISCLLAVVLLLTLLPPAQAQDASLPLPADLFVLTDGGQVMRIGVGGSFANAVTPPDQQVVDFSPSPDGRWVAYRTAPAETSSAFLAITAIDSQSGQVIEFEAAGQPPIEQRGDTLAWSPDGAAIAYTTADGLRVYLAGMGEGGGPQFVDLQGGPFINLVWSPGGGYLAAEAESAVWWIYRRDGGAVAYAGQIPGSAGVTWMQDGVLALAPPSGSLLLLDVRDGTQIGLLDGETFVSQPTRIEGGKLIFMVHESTGQRFAARRFGTVSSGGGDFEEFEAALELTSAMRWMPDGIALTTVTDGTLSLIEPRTNTRRDILDGVKAYRWGPLPPEEVSGLVMPADLYFLSRDEASVPQIWILPADGSPARPVTVEPRPVLDFAVSPDGSQIAYSSGGSLIVANSDGTAGRELSPITERPGAGAQPAWSPDGQLIAFVRDGIWLVPGAGGARTELITDNFTQDTAPDDIRVYMAPRWRPDGTLLLVDVGLYEGRALGILPITGGEVSPLPVQASYGAWTPDGKVLTWDYGFAATPGLYLVDPANLTTYTTILDSGWTIFDALPLAAEAAAVLRSPASDAMGPGTIQPFLVPILPDALPIPQGPGGLLEQPTLAPGGEVAAGLRNLNYGDYGQAGRLVVLNVTTGDRYAVQTPGEVWGLGWGPRRVAAP